MSRWTESPFSSPSTSIILTASYVLMDNKSPISSLFPQFFLSDFFQDLSCVLDIFQHLAGPFCSGSSLTSFT